MARQHRASTLTWKVTASEGVSSSLPCGSSASVFAIFAIQNTTLYGWRKRRPNTPYTKPSTTVAPRRAKSDSWPLEVLSSGAPRNTS